MREAAALVERVALRGERAEEPVVVGFRANGCASVYFGAEPAYHFNAANELRRAYVGGELWKAQDRRLVAMRRERTGTEVELRSRTLSAAEQLAALGQAQRQLQSLLDDLRNDRATLVASVPGEQARRRALDWLAALPPELVVARRPHAR